MGLGAWVKVRESNDPMKSKLAEDKRKRELLRLRKMTPEERLQALVTLNDRVKKIFLAGLNRQGVERKKIARLWKTK